MSKENETNYYESCWRCGRPTVFPFCGTCWRKALLALFVNTQDETPKRNARNVYAEETDENFTRR